MPESEFDNAGVPAQQTNGMAIAGFVCSLVGLVSGGHLLSPIGLILSLVALKREGGRGWAIAGIIIGGLGICGWLIAFLVVGTAMLAALGLGAAVTAVVLSEPERTELTVDAAAITLAIEAHREVTGALPADLDALDLGAPFLTDPWGNPYRYILLPDRAGYEIITNGPDGAPDTADDFNARNPLEIWQMDETRSPADPSQSGETQDAPPADE
ncbi:MAG: type II secretion system protein GspG [Planctomycetes bacterium]|nr:type II secretion system protein GspG [Planctomycetota bacterium]